MTNFYYGDQKQTQNKLPMATARTQENGGGILQSTFSTLTSLANDPTVQFVSGTATSMMKNSPQYQIAVNAAKVGSLVAKNIPTEQFTNNAAVQAVANNQAVQGVLQSAPVKGLGTVLSPFTSLAAGAYQTLLNEKGNPMLEAAIGAVGGSKSVTDVFTNAIKATPQYQQAVKAAQLGQTINEFIPTDQILQSDAVKGLLNNPALQGVVQNDQYKFVSQLVDPKQIAQMIMEDAKKAQSTT